LHQNFVFDFMLIKRSWLASPAEIYGFATGDE
jgi:hypothetical protein